MFPFPLPWRLKTEQAENHFEIIISTDNNRQKKTILTKIFKNLSVTLALGCNKLIDRKLRFR